MGIQSHQLLLLMEKNYLFVKQVATHEILIEPSILLPTFKNYVASPFLHLTCLNRNSYSNPTLKYANALKDSK